MGFYIKTHWLSKNPLQVQLTETYCNNLTLQSPAFIYCMAQKTFCSGDVKADIMSYVSFGFDSLRQTYKPKLHVLLRTDKVAFF